MLARLRPFLVIAIVVGLSGCLQAVVPGYGEAVEEAEAAQRENARLEGNLEEARRNLEATQATALLQAESLEALRTRLTQLDQARAQLENFSQRLARDGENLTGELALRETEVANLTGELEAAREDLSQRRDNLTRLEARLAEAERVTFDNKTLQQVTAELRAAKETLAELERKYEAALGDDYRSLTTIRAGNLTWHFTDLRGDARAWKYPMESYREYVKKSRPMDMLYLDTVVGTKIRVADPRPYVTPSTFEETAIQLTDGRSDRDFVREAFNFKRQLVVYQFSLIDQKGFYKYSAETLAEGTGICGDTTILLASLLLAGDKAANYGYEVALWVVYWDTALNRIVPNPTEINHAFIEVKFRDGTSWYLETTSTDLYLHPAASGWRYTIAPDVEQRALGA